MNFPDVPFDENLFASNSMLKSYWERSTNERSEANIPDWPSEEKYDDLRKQTLHHFDEPVVEPEAAEPEEPTKTAEVEPVAEVVNAAEPVKDAIVKPKALSTPEVVGIVLASVALAAILGYFFLVRYKGRRY